MIDAIGILLTDSAAIDLKELTKYRTYAALPIGGRYRIIDFMLSNLVNSGVNKVGVLPQGDYQSLIGHIDTGKPWELNRKNGGLHIIPPIMNSSNHSKGDIETLYNALYFLNKSRQKYLIISNCSSILNIDFKEVLDFHIAKNADITCVCVDNSNYSSNDIQNVTLLESDENGKVLDVGQYSKTPQQLTNKQFFTDIYCIDKNLLLNALENAIAHGKRSFIPDILIKNQHSLNIYSYKYSGFYHKITDIKSYYNFNMNMLDTSKRDKIFCDSNPIFTKPKDKAPTKYGKDSIAENCLISDGCHIEGTVINSVISQGVKIKRGAVVKNCIILRNCLVSENAHVENAILDNRVTLLAEKKLVGPKNYPLAIAKGEII